MPMSWSISEVISFDKFMCFPIKKHSITEDKNVKVENHLVKQKTACGPLEGGDRKQVMLPKRRNHRRQKELSVLYLFLPALSNL